MHLGELAALANAVIWAGLSVVLGRLGGRLSAVRVNAFQLCFAAAFYLLLIPFAGGGRLFAGLTLLRFFGLLATAVLTMGMGDSLYFTSISRIGASRASPISVSAFPLITLLFGALLLGEQLTLPVAGGAVLIIGGIALLVSESRQPAAASSGPAEGGPAPIAGASGDAPGADAQRLARPPDPTDRTQAGPAGKSLFVGVLLVLAAAVCWSAATLGLRVASAGLPAIAVTAIRVPTAALFLLGLLRSRGRLNTRGIDRRDWPLITAAGLIGTGLGSLTYIIAIQGTGAGLTALLTSTSPLWVLPLAALFLHERLTRRVVLGAALALGGIWLVLL
jgi:drug/metabolite transporter (DMT)-like permease